MAFRPSEPNVQVAIQVEYGAFRVLALADGVPTEKGYQDNQQYSCTDDKFRVHAVSELCTCASVDAHRCQ